MSETTNTPAELTACQESRDPALDCYVSAIRNIAHYAADLKPEITDPHRKYLEELAARTVCGTPEALNESGATLRGLLRDYRDKTSQYLNALREEMRSSAEALQEILETLGAADGDHGTQLRAALATLRQMPDEECPSVRRKVIVAAEIIENSLDGVRKQHQPTVSQFTVEIRVLHKRIDALESAASIDMVTKLLTQREMEIRIRERQAPGGLLLVHADGIRTAESNFGRAVAEELTGAVIRRLRNCLPAPSVIGRWSEQAFVAILDRDSQEAGEWVSRITGNLNGPYACLNDGKTVRPPVQTSVRMVNGAASDAEDALRQAEAFFGE